MTGMAAEYRVLWRLSWPAVLTQLGIMLTGVVDTLMVARIDVDALAASALANMWQWSFMSIGMGAVMGIDPVISQAHGRGDGPAMALALQRGLVVALLVSVPLCVCQILTEPGLWLLGQSPAVAALAQQYNLIKVPTIPCFLLFSAMRQYLQSRGLMVPVAGLMYGATALHALFNWALIFGHAGMPSLGLAGAAIASSLTTAVLVVGMWATIRLFGLDQGARRAWDSQSFSIAGISATLRLGLPVGFQMSLEAWAFTLATFMAGWIDVRAVGSHQIVLSMAALAFMVPLGISMGAATRVGNLIGQGDEIGMRRAVRASLVLGASVMMISAVAFTLLRQELPKLYTDDLRLIPLAAEILPLAGAFQLADGTQVVAGGVLRGMGRPHAAAVVNLVGYYVFALPLAYLLAFRLELGLAGVWIALALGLLGIATALLFWVRRTAQRPLAQLRVQEAAAVA